MKNQIILTLSSRLFLPCLLFLSGWLYANPQVDALLAQQELPDGVIFEIVEEDTDALDWALPAVTKYSKQLKQRFPDIEIAVVTHGLEEFALQKINQSDNAEAHQQVQQLHSLGIPVHVCETHAGWYGVDADDFPDYVDVVPAGPIQIDMYQQLGFILIRLETPPTN